MHNFKRNFEWGGWCVGGFCLFWWSVLVEFGGAYLGLLYGLLWLPIARVGKIESENLFYHCIVCSVKISTNVFLQILVGPHITENLGDSSQKITLSK